MIETEMKLRTRITIHPGYEPRLRLNNQPLTEIITDCFMVREHGVGALGHNNFTIDYISLEGDQILKEISEAQLLELVKPKIGELWERTLAVLYRCRGNLGFDVLNLLLQQEDQNKLHELLHALENRVDQQKHLEYI